MNTLTARKPWTRVVVELPVATSSADDAFFGEDDGVLLGNPYLGVETEPTTGGAHFAFGARVPIVSTDAPGLTTLAALLADYDRLEAYVPDLLTRPKRRNGGGWRAA